ncbi:hypothetical protein BDN70DRAFT_588180 [Pholiota conissans]|uniref:Uncharacterized protein n=1 Tax=Pholiota conissans TaxID=109636 RepID=A0A9P6CZP2_9AGAR|nr:hypothetical protein BDN70DRAFT_588180 [Pholiota conissans]
MRHIASRRSDSGTTVCPITPSYDFLQSPFGHKPSRTINPSLLFRPPKCGKLRAYIHANLWSANCARTLQLHLHLVHNFFQMHHRYLQRSLALFSWVFRKPIGCFLRRYRVFHALCYGYCSFLVDYLPNDKRESLGIQNTSAHGDRRFRAN